MNLQATNITRALVMAFIQTTDSEVVRNYLLRGKEIGEKHMEVFSGLLKESDLPASVTWDANITESTTWTFANKLIMFQTALLSATGVGDYGISMSLCHRRDIIADYARLSIEMARFAADGAKIMIKNGWLEEQPLASDRNKMEKG